MYYTSGGSVSFLLGNHFQLGLRVEWEADALVVRRGIRL